MKRIFHAIQLKFIKNTTGIKDLDDAALLLRYKSTGSLDALGMLYNRYMHLVYGVCLNYFKEEEASKDAVMQIFEELVLKLKIHEDTVPIIISGDFNDDLIFNSSNHNSRVISIIKKFFI